MTDKLIGNKGIATAPKSIDILEKRVAGIEQKIDGILDVLEKLCKHLMKGGVK